MHQPKPIATSRLEKIAFATSHGPDNQLRWTELGLYYRPSERRQFVAESIGKTTVRGEADFRRQRVGKSIEEVSRLFDNSRLADQIAEQASEWLERQPQVSMAAPAIQFDGSGGFRGAILWLYPAATADTSDNHLAGLFEQDWGVPARTVRNTLKQEQDGGDLTPWVKAFIGALQHFDREAFHASRRD